MKRKYTVYLSLITLIVFFSGCNVFIKTNLPDEENNTKWTSTELDMYFTVEDSSIENKEMVSYQSNMHGWIMKDGINSEIVVEKRIGYFSTFYYFYIFEPEQYQDPFGRSLLLFCGRVKVNDDKCIIKVKIKENSIGYDWYNSDIKKVVFTRDDDYVQ